MKRCVSRRFGEYFPIALLFFFFFFSLKVVALSFSRSIKRLNTSKKYMSVTNRKGVMKITIMTMIMIEMMVVMMMVMVMMMMMMMMMMIMMMPTTTVTMTA